jgi:hypothetical protein
LSALGGSAKTPPVMDDNHGAAGDHSHVLPEIPQTIAVERKRVLDRTLRHLPDAVLDAMRRGLDRHDGRLRPGRLFSAQGDCAVGVMLRELFPGYRADRRRRNRSVTDAHPQLARALPRLVHVELCFDVTIRTCREHDPTHTVADWAQAVGRWFAGCAYVELERRGRAAAEPLPAALPSLSAAA